MITDALKWLAEHVTKGQQPRLVRTAAEQVTVQWPSGDTSTIAFEPPPESHQVDVLDDFIAAVEGRRGEASDPCIFLGRERIVYFDSLLDRKTSLTLHLPTAPQFATVGKLQRDEPLGQRELVELLRHELHGFAPPELVTLSRKIEARSSQRGSSEITPGRERGTMEFEAEITSDIPVPEEVRFHVPVFEGRGLDARHWVDCSLYVTLPPSPVAFKIEAYPGELRRAVDDALATILTSITEAVGELPVLRGCTERWQPGKNGFFLTW